MHPTSCPRWKRAAGAAMVLGAAVAGLASCNGPEELSPERANQRAKEDVRDFRDYLRERHVIIDTPTR